MAGKKTELAKNKKTPQEIAASKELTAKNFPQIIMAIERVNAVNVIRDQIMQENVHYGIVPGTNKMALRKPGIDILCVGFEYNIDVSIEYEELEGYPGHREYSGKGTVVHIPTGQVMGVGTGSCCTLESKYRWRFEYTTKTVPSDYWKTRDPQLLGGEDFVAKKTDNGWVTARRIANKDIADQYNTCAKMAEKRVRSQCITNVTGCSALFEQEDIDPFSSENITEIDIDVVQDETVDAVPGQPITKPQVSAILSLLNKHEASVEEFLKDYLIADVRELEQTNFVVAGKDIKADKYAVVADPGVKKGNGF